MAISSNKYVDITSGVAGATEVPNRELIGRLFTSNTLLPSGSYIEFSSAAEVGEYFGTSSEEYLRALFYFSWISKEITRPRKLSFGRWVETNQAPMIYGGRLTQTLAQLKTITALGFALTMGGVTNQIDSLDFSGAADLAAIATIIQTKIRTKTGLQWTAATVTYNATRGSFDLVGGSAVAADISVEAPSSGDDISSAIAWLVSDDAIWSDGKLAESITDTLTLSDSISDNFGSFLFIPSLTIDQVIEAAEWNLAQNVKYQYHVPVSAANASTWAATLAEIGGVSLTLAPISTEYPEQMWMMILAATDYLARNSTQNYMYQKFTLTPSVTSTTLSNTYDALRVNYYGVTQEAGASISFSQRGYLMGLSTDPKDMNTYANEQWLKDAMKSALLNLLLALNKISANKKGVAQILTTLQSIILLALNNGTISVGKELTNAQKLDIAEITGDQDAWYQVQNIGYWVDCVIVLEDTEYVAKYTLVYSKDDIIRKIEGTQILI